MPILVIGFGNKNLLPQYGVSKKFFSLKFEVIGWREKKEEKACISIRENGPNYH